MTNETTTSRQIKAAGSPRQVALYVYLATALMVFTAPVSRGAISNHIPDWHAMGSEPCIWGDPLRAAGNALDVNATIQDLRENGFNCYALVVENAPPNSYHDLQRLLPAAQSAGILVWAILIPPSEQELGGSLPYHADYVQWMRTLAHLALTHPALRGVNIDDYLSGISAKTFTRSYTCRLYQAKQAINPKLLFTPTIYELDADVANQLAGCVDGAWLWWTNLQHNDSMKSLLEDSRVVVAGRFPVYSGVYAHATSWHKQGPPEPRVLRGALELACRYSNGAIIWSLALGPKSSENPLQEVARAFTPGGSADLAGKCGIASH